MGFVSSKQLTCAWLAGADPILAASFNQRSKAFGLAGLGRAGFAFVAHLSLSVAAGLPDDWRAE